MGGWTHSSARAASAHPLPHIEAPTLRIQRHDAHAIAASFSTVSATTANGNKFELEKAPDSDATQTVRFKSMYVKGGAPLRPLGAWPASTCMGTHARV